MWRLALMFGVLVGWGGNAHKTEASAQVHKERAMSVARGSFQVKIAPADVSDLGKQAELGRMTIDKVFSGDLEAVSKGEMLTGSTESTGSMAYVAIERVTGKLAGHSGSFVLMHNATMTKGDAASGALNVTVVPGSGTGELHGLSGSMKIIIDSTGKHAYEFTYEL